MVAMDKNIDSFEEYLLKEKNYSKLTIRAYKDDLVSFFDFLEHSFGGLSYLEVKYVHVRSWVVFLVDSGLQNRSVNRKISSLKSFYLFLMKVKLVFVNPLLRHKSLKVSKKIQVPFSEKEINEVFQDVVLDDFEGVRDLLIVELFYATGVRRSELINLKVQDVDFYSFTIKVLGKRNKERVLPMLASTLRILKDYLVFRKGVVKGEDLGVLILSKKGNKVSESFVYRLINDYFSSVSQKVKKSPHVLRHSFATHLLNNGADLNSVKELLGHASLSSTQIYTHSSLGELKKVYSGTHPRGQG